MAREASEGSSSSDEEAGCDKPKGSRAGAAGLQKRPQAHATTASEACAPVRPRSRRVFGRQPRSPVQLGRLHQADQLGPPQDPAARLILSLRCLRQCSTDNGKPRFGGEHQQLEEVAGYVKAMVELEKKARQYSTLPGADQAEEPAEPKTYNPKNKKWQKGAQVRAGDKPVE